ncbi:hypothetical protein DERF_006891 [Dermatophagoides farinae]|uniref:Uncharacterized protein n=1 Tax=Dermatophagoides farinae TaxID=6954 RepID=A0A922HWT9_DERFA|nr:hypothetical protein DERF_006891 [Dermatophagoides farinae]
MVPGSALLMAFSHINLRLNKIPIGSHLFFMWIGHLLVDRETTTQFSVILRLYIVHLHGDIA